MKNSKIVNMPFRHSVIPPPKELKQPGSELWNSIQNEYGISDPGGLAHLLTACRSEDDITRLRDKVKRDGDTLRDRFKQIREHPLLAAIRGLEAVKRQSLKALNMDIEPQRDKPGRPGGR